MPRNLVLIEDRDLLLQTLPQVDYKAPCRALHNQASEYLLRLQSFTTGMCMFLASLKNFQRPLRLRKTVLIFEVGTFTRPIVD